MSRVFTPQEMMSRVPAEDVEEVQADWKKASFAEKKQMVWDVRKLLDDEGDDDGDDDDAPEPGHADAPKPPPKAPPKAPPPPRGGYTDDSKSEVRVRVRIRVRVKASPNPNPHPHPHPHPNQVRRRGGGAARPKCPGSRHSPRGLPRRPRSKARPS